ncbi:hypothetical protein ACFYRL_28405 [Streptomyces goshikiensis]|uniref:hypothetical protein n=1 Tax=Streptomyces goshikiensis TaxID=1942 RepID=UPI0036BC9344
MTPGGAAGDIDEVSGHHGARRNAGQPAGGREGQLPSCGAPFDIEGAGAFLGTGVGKTTHHDQGPAPAGKKAFYKPMPHSEPERRTVFDNLKAKFGKPDGPRSTPFP